MARELRLVNWPHAVALVDDEDYERCAQYEWRMGKKSYVTGRAELDGVRRNYMLHRFLMGAGFGDRRIVDHINGDKLDNRRSNLRFATALQSTWNRRLQNRHWTPYRGVYRWKTQVGVVEWVAELTAANKKYRAGPFPTDHEAARAYDELARKHYGEFARLNYPREGEQAAA